MKNDFTHSLDDDVIFERKHVFSPMDKLSWQNRIEKHLDLALYFMGNYGQYHIQILRVEQSLDANFAGLDLSTPIKKNLDTLKIEKKKELLTLIKACDNGVYYHPQTLQDLTFKDKDIIKEKMYFWYWGKRHKFCFQLIAKYRGLLWGKQPIPGGKQMKDL